MWIELLQWTALVVSMAGVFFVLSFYLKLRLTANKLMAVASDDFFSSAESLLKTPEELPETVLGTLEVMSHSINDGSGTRALLSMLKRANSGGIGSQTSSSSIVDDFQGMRPELQKLFIGATVGWLNFVTQRSVFGNFAISMELDRLMVKSDLGAGQHGKRFPSDEQRAMTLLPGIQSGHC